MATTFKGNTKAYLSRQVSTNWQGEIKFGSQKRIRCSIIHFKVGQADVSIRADRSESKGRAEEDSGKFRILVDPKVRMASGDKLQVHNQALRVITVFPRQSLDGKFHHLEVDLEIWQE